jgi:hypothetical protein
MSKYTSLTIFHRRLSIMKMLIHWVITFFGNLAGALFVTCIIFGCKTLSSLRPFYFPFPHAPPLFFPQSAASSPPSPTKKKP